MPTKSDRVLVWLTLLTLVFGGLGATVSVFLTDVVMARRHSPPSVDAARTSSTSGSTFEGAGIIVAVESEKSRLVLDHDEIKGFVGPMVKGYSVTSSSLLKNLKPGDSVHFKIDADQRAIVDVTPHGK